MTPICAEQPLPFLHKSGTCLQPGNNRTSHCDTYLLDLNTKQWTQGPSMNHCRFWHSCSLITNATTGEREVVIVGGTDQQRENRCKYIQQVEIVNLDTMQVRNGETIFYC